MNNINNPTHYDGKTLKAIDVIEDFDLDFHLGNVIKYTLRAGKKDSALDDLKKAAWYLQRRISQIEDKSKAWEEFFELAKEFEDIQDIDEWRE